jgi:hypothetical protein
VVKAELFMRRIFRFFLPARTPTAPAWTLTGEQHRELLSLLSGVGLEIVARTRGPVPLLTFARCVLEHLQPGRRFVDPVPLHDFAGALKAVIRDMDDERLRVLSPSDFPGVGYVFNAADPETWPVVRASA